MLPTERGNAISVFFNTSSVRMRFYAFHKCDVGNDKNVDFGAVQVFVKRYNSRYKMPKMFLNAKCVLFKKWKLRNV